MFAAFLAIHLVVMIGAPLALMGWIARRTGAPWSSFGAGVLCFIASQIVHVPSFYFVQPRLIGAEPSLAVFAIVSGLNAAICEELARWLFLRYWRKDDRSGPHALTFGIGHAWIEDVILPGVLGLASLYSVALISRVGVENLGLDAATEDLVRSGMADAERAPWMVFGTTLERASVLAFHVSASCLVMLAVVRRQPLWLLAAIGWHVTLDTGMVLMGSFGPIATLGWIAGLVPFDIAIVYFALRALPRVERPPEVPRPVTSSAPLELHHATKSFGNVTALDDVSFTLKNGERACLLGPNGAGKTTAIRLFVGALAPTSGWAFVFGTTSREPGFLASKRRVGIVPQQPGMYDSMSVRAYLDLVRAFYECGPYDDVAARLGMSELYDRMTSKLSGGQQRRLCLTAALMSEPELLILDEPSAGLDPIAAREMMDALKRASADRTTLLCTHDLDEAEELCESVVILRRGKVIVHREIAALRREAPARLALRAAQGHDALAAELHARGYEPALEDGATTFPITDGENAAPLLLRELLAKGLDVYECRVLRPTLEDLFLHFVKKDGA
jgi:ABC-2 type transport system ATP-binding protein